MVGRVAGERPGTMSTKAEPLPRKDGCCVVCDKRIPATASKYAEPDPFCSRKCCQVFHGTELAIDVEIPEHVGARGVSHPISQKPRQW